MTTAIEPRILKKVRALCLALPETTEGAHFGKVAFYVGKKLFATAGNEKGRSVIALGLEPMHAELLVENDPRASRYPRSRDAVVLDVSNVKDWDEIAALLRESYELAKDPKKRTAAPKRPKRR